ncbi:hypothetical protein BDV35DRAFT_361106 [Aspergillus flavus]|uniref:Uncharacterized protein n=1 Tax=Aspergillus flavus TaxID=5059 RepID=A0A5N6GNR5_ASPFL|nr:hypothetical protein BDV35DRAFT_361106 [Aspergillus flavus]
MLIIHTYGSRTLSSLVILCLFQNIFALSGMFSLFLRLHRLPLPAMLVSLLRQGVMLPLPRLQMWKQFTQPDERSRSA